MKTNIKSEIKIPRVIGYPDITYSIRNYKSLSHVISNKAYVLRPFFNSDRNKEGLHPLVIYVVGGGFTVCPPLSQLSTLYEIAKNGYVVASISYPTANFSPFPSQIEDIKSAIRFFRKNFDKFGIDPDKIAIMGESAGATLAVLAGLTSDSGLFTIGENTDVSDKVSAVIDLYGPVDLSGLQNYDSIRYHAARMLLFSSDEVPSDCEKSFNPIQYITHDAPPFLIIHGTNDRIVDVSDSEKLYENLVKKGVKADLLLLENAEHADVLFCLEEINERILSFLKENLN